RLAAAFLRQRDVRATRVAERLAPLRLPVPHEHDLLRHAADLDRSRLAERRGGKASNVDARPRPSQLHAALAAAGLATAGFGAAPRGRASRLRGFDAPWGDLRRRKTGWRSTASRCGRWAIGSSTSSLTA